MRASSLMDSQFCGVKTGHMRKVSIQADSSSPWKADACRHMHPLLIPFTPFFYFKKSHLSISWCKWNQLLKSAHSRVNPISVIHVMRLQFLSSLGFNFLTYKMGTVYFSCRRKVRKKGDNKCEKCQRCAWFTESHKKWQFLSFLTQSWKLSEPSSHCSWITCHFLASYVPCPSASQMLLSPDLSSWITLCTFAIKKMEKIFTARVLKLGIEGLHRAAPWLLGYPTPYSSCCDALGSWWRR